MVYQCNNNNNNNNNNNGPKPAGTLDLEEEYHPYLIPI